mmetsp:Transcript_17360/g.41116  ORF Transcript_17360/g.41116 Transcript_17360/m.41116 type:complete len:314 (-) Transcript_17360:109-1050(-)
MLAHGASPQDAPTSQRIGRLEACDQGTLLAEALGAVLPLAQPHPVTCADQVRQGRLQRRPGGIGARGEPAHSAWEALHVAVHHLHPAEPRHRRRQQLLGQEPHQLLVGQRQQGPGVVKVASHHGALDLLPGPELLLVALQLVEHEEGAPRTPQLRELRPDVRRGLGVYLPVQPQTRGGHVDALQRGGPRQLRAAPRQLRRAPQHRAQAPGAQRQNHRVEVQQPGVAFDAEPPDAVAGDLQRLHKAAAFHLQAVLLDQVIQHRTHQILAHGALLQPPHVEGALMGQGVEVEQLHGHRGRQLLRRLEEPHQQRGL